MTTRHNIEELAAVLESSLGASFNPQGYALNRELIILLAEGQPVSPERVASVLGLSRGRPGFPLHPPCPPGRLP